METGQKITDTSTTATHSANVFAQQPADTTVLTDFIQKQLEGVSYEIDKIVDFKKEENGAVSYNVQWVAHTWIPADILSPFQHLIGKYWKEREANGRNDEFLQVTEQMIEEGTSVECKENGDVNKDTNEIVNNEVLVLEQSTVTNCTNENSGEKLEMYCPKCNQRFFMKSNLEVHLLFCEKNVEQMASKIDMQKLGVNELTTTVIDGISPININSVRDALKISQTFEYIPLANDNNDECKSCLQRFPSGPSIDNLDVTELLWNANKKVFSDQVEVFECLECSRDFLYKHPVVAKDPSTIAFTMLRAKRFLSKPFKCSICDRGFDDEREMLTHEGKHSSCTTRYSCAKCNEKFSTRILLQNHYNSDLNSCSPRKCNICSREFVHSNHLRRHMSIHAGIKPFVCTVCFHEFNQKSDLQRHEKRHSVEGKLACVKCDLIFESADELREHVTTHKNISEELVFRCELCPKVFGRKSHYKRHLTIHEGLKPHVCEHCGKSFNQRTDLKRHQLTHSRKKETKTLKDTGDSSVLSCQICNKTFPTQLQYEAHELTHKRIMNTGLSY